MTNNVKKFEDLMVWKESVNLATQIYKLIRKFRDFGLCNQIQRSTVSIASNIAEGFERQSNKEFIQFLFIAKASCGGLRTQLYIAENIEQIEKETSQPLIEKTKKISAMLFKLIKTRKENF